MILESIIRLGMKNRPIISYRIIKITSHNNSNSNNNNMIHSIIYTDMDSYLRGLIHHIQLISKISKIITAITVIMLNLYLLWDILRILVTTNFRTKLLKIPLKDSLIYLIFLGKPVIYLHSKIKVNSKEILIPVGSSC